MSNAEYRLWNIDYQLGILSEVDEEEMTYEEWAQAVDALGREREELILSLCRLYKFQKERALAAKRIADNFLSDAKVKDRKADRTLQSIIKYSKPEDRLSDDHVSLKWNKAPGKVIVDNEHLIPDSCWRQRDPEIDKSAISKLLKAGAKVPGCHLDKSPKINIK